MPTDTEPLQEQRAFVRPGFEWRTAGAYLFDIDGTLLNSRDLVHYNSFTHAMRDVMGVETTINGLALQGNTEPGILRDALRRVGFDDEAIIPKLPELATAMCEYVREHAQQLRPELCPSILELVNELYGRGKLLGVASGNLETIGWLKLERAGVRHMFSFGSFSVPRQSRAEIFAYGIDQARERLGGSVKVHVIGDTPSDVTAARVVGVPVIALATGIFSYEELLACEPDACFGCGADMLAHTTALNGAGKTAMDETGKATFTSSSATIT
ncbi:MAG TPA: HAD hydrolase-like protein [Candidatus Limnocylindrales bacterium]|jgi:phosphoglycolate phosphatase-like HAD superfamily hydrolase|nr:HAD hydrolase-like protein [Candidatus Limnocylindrales bacterium]